MFGASNIISFFVNSCNKSFDLDFDHNVGLAVLTFFSMYSVFLVNHNPQMTGYECPELKRMDINVEDLKFKMFSFLLMSVLVNTQQGCSVSAGACSLAELKSIKSTTKKKQ